MSDIKKLVNTAQRPSFRDGNVELLPQGGTVASVRLSDSLPFLFSKLQDGQG